MSSVSKTIQGGTEAVAELLTTAYDYWMESGPKPSEQLGGIFQDNKEWVKASTADWTPTGRRFAAYGTALAHAAVGAVLSVPLLPMEAMAAGQKDYREYGQILPAFSIAVEAPVKMAWDGAVGVVHGIAALEKSLVLGDLGGIDTDDFELTYATASTMLGAAFLIEGARHAGNGLSNLTIDMTPIPLATAVSSAGAVPAVAVPILTGLGPALAGLGQGLFLSTATSSSSNQSPSVSETPRSYGGMRVGGKITDRYSVYDEVTLRSHRPSQRPSNWKKLIEEDFKARGGRESAVVKSDGKVHRISLEGDEVVWTEIVPESLEPVLSDFTGYELSGPRVTRRYRSSSLGTVKTHLLDDPIASLASDHPIRQMFEQRGAGQLGRQAQVFIVSDDTIYQLTRDGDGLSIGEYDVPSFTWRSVPEYVAIPGGRVFSSFDHAAGYRRGGNHFLAAAREADAADAIGGGGKLYHAVYQTEKGQTRVVGVAKGSDLRHIVGAYMQANKKSCARYGDVHPELPIVARTPLEALPVAERPLIQKTVIAMGNEGRYTDYVHAMQEAFEALRHIEERFGPEVRQAVADAILNGQREVSVPVRAYYGYGRGVPVEPRFVSVSELLRDSAQP